MISGNIGGFATYAAVQGSFAAPKPDAPKPDALKPDGAEGSFGGALQAAMTNLSDLGQDADAKSVQALTGGGKLTDVVMAVSKAEMALQASVAVRDKVVSAYQDIMRMAV